MAKKSSKKQNGSRTLVLKTITECAPVANSVFLYGTQDLKQQILEAAITAPDPFVLSFGLPAYSENKKFDNVKMANCTSWLYLDSAFELIAEYTQQISTVIIDDLVTAYDVVLRRILAQNHVIYPNSKDIWTEALYRIKSLLAQLVRLKKNIILIAGSHEIHMFDEVNNALFYRPSTSDSIMSTIYSTYDAVLFMHKDGKTKKLVVEGESPENNWFIATCKSPTLKSKLSLNFSDFLNPL